MEPALASAAPADVAALADEVQRLEAVAPPASQGSPMHHALLRHRPVSSPCGLVSVALPQPAALTALQRRLDSCDPAEGIFDPDLLGRPEARDELHVELRGPGGAHGLRLWAFLAHLVTPADLLPAGDADSEDEPGGGGGSTQAAATPGLHRVFESGSGNWTGTLLWDAAVHATAHILGSAEWSAAVRGSACVLELGAGLGLPALACAALGARRVAATDRVPQVLALLEENAARNFESHPGTTFSVLTLDWSADAARELPARLGAPVVDTVIACDCILQRLFGAAEALAEFLEALAAGCPELRCLLASELRPECGVGAFLRRAGRAFQVRRVAVDGFVHLFELRPAVARHGGTSRSPETVCSPTPPPCAARG